MHFIIASVFIVGLALCAPQDKASYDMAVEAKPDTYGEYVVQPEIVKPYIAAEPYSGVITEPKVYDKPEEYAPPEVYTPAPVVYTPAPEVYTPAPVVYTPAPEVYTSAPVVYTPAPEVYNSPEIYTDKPEEYASPEIYADKPEEYASPEVYTEAEVLVEPEIDIKPENKALHKGTVIISTGKKLSEALTAKIVGPIVLFNSKLAAAAGALPPMLAAKGAVIGSAIATPIEIGAVAGSGIVSGMTGKLVAVPISVGAGALAKIVDAAESGKQFLDVQSASGKQIWDFNVAHGGQVLKNGLIKIGHVLLKPVAVVVGAQTALTGAGLGIAGTGVKGVGVGMEAVGAKLIASGLLAKGVGHRLIVKNFPPYLK